ncbi:MAG TPA: putative baseplate assembly protein [Pseudonocardiaceae bacterium]|jgi:predicted phage baseplate assembly protein|nr:putative baseplate assembly protein [Pseudonocardiaceae bacterium]
MALPAPNLDDRHFQDLVDDAKRLVQQRCPEWTDHNVSDPGVTLIEAFASMVDQLGYRLNRVPARHYLRFLDLIGVRLYPPTAARADVTFWLSAPQPAPVLIPADTPICTSRADNPDLETVVFGTTQELTIVPCALEKIMTAGPEGDPVDQTERLRFGGLDQYVEGEEGIPSFGSPPQAGDSLLMGLSVAVPRCAVLLRLDCEVEGVGVDPEAPPLVWEAWDGDEWVVCEVGKDETGGLNRPGDIVLHVPAGHTASVINREQAGWLRCRVLVPVEGQPFYSAPPQVRAATAATIGGTIPAVHAETIRDEIIGISEGVPGQRFTTQHSPIVPGEQPLLLEVAGGDGWEPWQAVEHFATSGPSDRHFMIDPMAGEVVFGPAVRESDGSLRQYGAVPPKAAPLRLPVYRTGGGQRGNVARGLLKVQRAPVPFVTAVENRRPATGGVEGEGVANAALRGPLLLRTRDRAVTAEDYEMLARQAAPEVARVRAVVAGPDVAAGGVRLLVVPAIGDDGTGRLRFEELLPAPGTLAAIARYLDERRCLGARVMVEPPYYQGVTVVARLTARPRASLDKLRGRATEALYRYLNPISGGPEGSGWPFGRPVQAGEVFAVLQRLDGVDLVEDVRLFSADPVTGDRGEAVARLELGEHALIFSYGHQVRVTPV